MGDSVVDTIVNGQLVLAILLATLAGLISFASPCVLPLIPGYLAYVGGMATTDGRTSRRRTVIGVALFVLGFALVFVAYGAAFGSIGLWLLRWEDLLTRVMGGFLILMGAVFVGAIPWMQRTARVPQREYRCRPAWGWPAPHCLALSLGLAGRPASAPRLPPSLSSA